jgi:hypothetical protein
VSSWCSSIGPSAKALETDKRDGKIIGIAKMTVSADGKTAKIVFEDKLHGMTTKLDANKQ